MGKRTWAPRDTWPGLTVTVEVLPWAWWFKPYHHLDTDDGLWLTVAWLFLKISWISNSPMFTDRPVRAPRLGPYVGEAEAARLLAKPKGYPHDSGDVTVLGPGVFAKPDGSVLNWDGVNYVPQPAPEAVSG